MAHQSQQYLALITVLTGPHPPPVDPGYSPPWARPQPPRPWGPINYPDNSLPGNQPYPDQGLPGSQPRPDHSLPPFPSHPIYIPPEGSPPPLGIWGPTDPRPGFGLPGPQPHPEHPIVLPPDLPEETPEGGKITWKTAWSPQFAASCGGCAHDGA